MWETVPRKNCFATVGVCVFRALASAGALFFGRSIKENVMITHSKLKIFDDGKLLKILKIIALVFSGILLLWFTFDMTGLISRL